MDAVRLKEHELDVHAMIDRVEAGQTVEVVRDGRVVAKVSPPEPSAAERPTPHPSWKEAGVDWDEIARFAATLKYDPTNSVVEMRKEARY